MGKKIIKIFLLISIAISLVNAAWPVFHQNIHFSSDIARDFLLMNEISQKKIVLIGERTPISGLFHGPLWLYLNVPAYLLGNGDPIVVGYFWIFLFFIYFLLNYFIGKDIFQDKTVALAYIAMLASYSVFHADRLINAHGIYFFLPFYFYFLYKYINQPKVKYLICHLILVGLLSQSHIGAGIIYMILSGLATIFFALKNNKKLHVLVLLLIPFMMANFILFDLRHGNITSKAIYKNIIEGNSYGLTLLDKVIDRLKAMSVYMEITREYQWMRNIGIFTIAILVYKQLKTGKKKRIYWLFVYLYLGFFILSLLNNGFLLSFYLYGEVPLLYIMFSSFLKSRYKKLSAIVVFAIIFLNLLSGLHRTLNYGRLITSDEYSWKLLKIVSAEPFKGEEGSFGYFIYAPDAFGYQLNYAMLYQTKRSNKDVYRFVKRPITYLIEESNKKTGFSTSWWIKNKLNLKSEPEWTKTFTQEFDRYGFML